MDNEWSSNTLMIAISVRKQKFRPKVSLFVKIYFMIPHFESLFV